MKIIVHKIERHEAVGDGADNVWWFRVVYGVPGQPGGWMLVRARDEMDVLKFLTSRGLEL